MIVAIDGPAGSGKSTTAKAVADKLGMMFLDTGAMYRAVALSILRENVDLRNIESVKTLLNGTKIELSRNNSGLKVTLNGEDITDKIRTQEINAIVSEVSEVPAVREFLVPQQRIFAEGRDIVAEGRDLGTVVFPDAEVKVFLVASEDERARRRMKELRQKGAVVDVEGVLDSIKKRDRIDSTREHSPLKKAEDAIEIDTTKLRFEEQVEKIVDIVKQKTVV
ncbi:MAG: (d)CMP kinase [candidate division Zixibacteria bacterium]|nr:(d)CMP kinase [candidate division Zixibacteria bacterium]